MSRICALTGKRPTTGNNVSHSNRKTKRRFLPNLFTKTFIDPRTGKKFRAKISTSALRTITKNSKKLLELAIKVVR
ncbi:50S ribosomal protein L28 [Candidatus Peregrinibacteria bacterium CG11_big_fil_rev_8_21_14_0_20_41_10]|nr:MAG: 50S ribosomal protein L28 [Candidatus Peregrinibacteria bacterium CG11_big_fil_rev_8_21_14_0_20_41_10]PIZ77946.1 MAG: 50S ribosomal protein L28 [Candidatus Peregrinibacteria bacterium CG_4_10_14_0_2_um_filter_41_8]